MPNQRKDQLPSGGAMPETPEATVLRLKFMMTTAAEIFDRFTGRICAHMTEERAREVRSLRVGRGYSWREIAQEISGSWGADLWVPSDSEVAGMVLCDNGARILGEDPQTWRQHFPGGHSIG